MPERRARGGPSGAASNPAHAGAICPAGRTDLPTERWVQDMRDKNLRDVMILLGPHPTFADPSGKTYRGRQSIRRLYSEVFKTFDSEIVMTEQTREWSQNVCIQTGTYTEDPRTRATGAIAHYAGTFRFSYVLRPKGEWRLARQVWTAE